MLLHVAGMQLLHDSSRVAMQPEPLSAEQLFVQRLTEKRVRESELQEPGVGVIFEDSSSHRLLERRNQSLFILRSLSCACRQTNRLQDIEREVAPEHRCDSQDLICLATEAIEALPDHVAEPLRNRLRTRQRAGRHDRISFVEETLFRQVAE